MAGIGVKLNRIYHKNTITTNVIGFFYSIVVTIAPVLVVIINLMLMQKVLKFNTVGYFDRELFSCTVFLADNLAVQRGTVPVYVRCDF